LKKRNILIAVLVMVVLAIVAVVLWNTLTAPQGSNASELMDRLEKGEVTAVDINNDEVVYKHKGKE